MQDNKMVLETIMTAWRNIRQGTTELIHFNSNSSENFISISEDFLERVDSEKYQFFHNKSSLNENSSYYPFTPFTDFIFSLKDKGIPITEIINEAKIYPALEKTIKSFLTTGLAKRDTPLIHDETEYEQLQLIKSIAAIIVEISNFKPIIFCISNLHNASPLTLSLLKQLIEDNDSGEILLLLDFNRLHYFHNNIEQEAWEKYLSYIDENSFVIELEEKELKTIWGKNKHNPKDKELLKLAETNFALLSFHEATIIGGELLKKLEKKTPLLSPKKQLELLKIIAMSFLYLKETDIALHYFNLLLNLADKLKNKTMIAFTYRQIAMMHLLNNNIPKAKKAILLSVDLNKQIDNEEEYTNTIFTYYSIYNHLTERIPKETYEELLLLLNKYGYENMLALCLSSSLLYSEELSSFDKIESDIEKAIDIAHRNKNLLGLSIYYHRLGIVYEHKEKYERAFHAYLKSKELNKKLNNPVKMIRVNNGMGYLFFLQEKYTEAFDCYHDNFDLLSRISDYNEIMVSLFNFATLFMVTRNYKQAIDLFQKVLKIMEIMKMEEIPFQTKSNVIIYKAFCHYKINQKQKAFQELQVVMSRLQKNTYELTGESKLFYYMLVGLYEYKNNNDKEVFTYFMKAKDSLNESAKKNKAFLSIFYIEYIQYLQSKGDRKTAEFVLKKGIQSCEELKFDKHRDWLYSAYYKNELEPIEFNEKIEFKFNALVEIARREINLTKLNKKNREIDFINLSQTIFENSENKTDIAQKILDLIMINFQIQEGYIHIVIDNEWQELYSQFPSDSEPIFIQPHLHELRGKNNEGYITNIEDFKWLPKRYKSIVSLPGLSKKEHIINLFLGTTKESSPLRIDEIKIISIVFQQLKIVFEKIDIQSKLLFLSKIDPLTGLYNRDSLKSRIYEEAKRLTRYIGKTTKRNLCITFIDLYNFKYYNNNFGRDIGDIILKDFSAMLKKNYREVDFLARYEGDKFLIILPETDEEEAYQSASRLLDNINKEDSFRVKIEDSLQEKISIPETKKLSLSIGISQLKETDSKKIDIEALISEAEEALNKAKKMEKGGIQLRSKM